MSYPSTQKQSSVAIVGAVVIAFKTGIPAAATTFNPAPLFEEVSHYTTTISANGDLADVYFPVVPDSTPDTPKFPIAFLLQGALVDKSDYSNFANQVARYGFVVVVPNHLRTVTNPSTGETRKGLLSEQQQVSDVLAQMVVENSTPSSPVANLVDTDKLGLLGHSFGGFVGLAAIQNICFSLVCFGSFNQPPELMAGIFYGTNFRNPPRVGAFPPVENGGIPTALIAGSRDGVAKPDTTIATYNQIQDPPKALIIVEGANHYGITNEDNLVRDPIRPTLDQAVATETIARWSALFLRAHLLNDAGAFDYVYNTGDVLDENVSVTSQTQPIPEPASALGVVAFGVWSAGSLLKHRRKKVS